MQQVDDTPRDTGPQRPLLWVLGCASFVVSLDGRVMAPLLPAVAAHYGTSIARAGWLVSAYLLPYGLFQLAYGPLGDRLGKVRVATRAMVAFSVGAALCGAFSSFEALVTLRGLTGAAAAAVIPLTIAYIGDTVPYARRQAALSSLMASVGAAQALSVSVGGLIAAVLDWQAVFPLFGALGGAVALGLFCFGPRELRREAVRGQPLPSYRAALRIRPLLVLLLFVGAEGFLFLGELPYISGLLEERFGLGPLAIGLILAGYGAAQFLAARLLPWLLRRLSERHLLALGGCCLGVASLLFAIARSWLVVVVGCLFIGAGFSLYHTTLQTRATEAFPSGRGTALSLFAFALFSGGALGSVCIGAATLALGYGATFAATSVALFASTAFAVALLGPRSPDVTH